MKASTVSRLKLLIIFLAFFGPMFIATFLYIDTDAPTRPSSNHGKLLTPIQTLPPIEAQDIGSGLAVSQDFLLGKWTLLYWASHCDLYCQADLFKMRQVRLSLGRNAQRLQMLFLLNDTANAELKALLSRHPRLSTAHIKQGSDFAVKLKALPKQHIFIVDTYGNLVMQYDHSAHAKGIFKDMKQLLKVSRIG